MLRAAFLPGIAALLLSGCGAGEAPATGTAITNVTVIDAVNGVRQAQTVVFDGDRIVTVAPTGERVDAAEVIDGTGQYLLPGLWDMHVHLTYDDAFTASMPRMFLAHGITSVRDTGGLLPKLAPVIESMRAEGAVAPRVYFSGPLLDGDYVVYDGQSRPEIGTENADRTSARDNVASLHEAGVDFIKIYEMVSPEVFDALAQAARDLGLPIAAHVPLSMRAGTAGPRVDSMEHLRNVELDCAANAPALHEERLSVLAAHDGGPGFELRSRLHALQRLDAIAAHDPARCAETIDSLAGTIQVPTLRLNTFSLYPPFARDDWDSVLELLPPGAAGAWREATLEWRQRDEADTDTTFAEWSLDLTGRMNAAGVPIGAGTDTPIGYALPGDSLHTELERLVDAGLTPIEALEAATIQPARFFGLERSMGQVAPGMAADLILLSADPLADISNTRRIERVIAAGRSFIPGELLAGATPRTP